MCICRLLLLLSGTVREKKILILLISLALLFDRPPDACGVDVTCGLYLYLSVAITRVAGFALCYVECYVPLRDISGVARGVEQVA